MRETGNRHLAPCGMSPRGGSILITSAPAIAIRNVA
jgi:hypothetical protein